jgi:hypothetical protein
MLLLTVSGACCSLARRPAPPRIGMAVRRPSLCRWLPSCGCGSGMFALSLLLVLLLQRPGVLQCIGVPVGKGCCRHCPCGLLLPLHRLLRRLLHPASGIRVRVCHRGRRLLLRGLRRRLL